MKNLNFLLFAGLAASVSTTCFAELPLVRQHCGKCHTGRKPKGDFSLHDLGNAPSDDSSEFWVNSLERIRAGEMPPAKHNQMTADEQSRIEAFLRSQITLYEEKTQRPTHVPPRRLNNREFENSIRDVLLIEDIGTHQPTAMLLGDTLHDGFDTHCDTLSLSEHHLDQYIVAVRSILDAIIFSGPQPASKRYEISSSRLRVTDRSHRKREEKANRTVESIDILDIRKHAYFDGFETVPTSGRYHITLRAQAMDRHVYDQERTGIYDDDPIRLRAHMGDRTKDFDLPEDSVAEIELNEWLAAGTSLQFSFPTDGLRLVGNGNFKFQYRIAHDFIKTNRPKLYQRVITEEVPKAKSRSDSPSHWVHWTKYWQGPRPRLYNATVEGPLYDSWPPKRQIALLGENPRVNHATAILKPIAQRAWRRPVADKELDSIVNLVQTQAKELGDVEALKEGIIAILVSPSFLMINPEDATPASRFSTRLSYLLGSSTPDADLITSVNDGELADFASIKEELQARIQSGRADDFLREFPYGWLQLDRINFMAPDIDRYPLYEKKAVNEDMVNEVLAFFRHAVAENRPVPELLTADYSFINADLAKVYGVEDVPSDSVHRKYVFRDGRRGGFLGMGAFLTLTADTLSTSPIHRAVYVMENFMGIHPAPPPADVEIKEPDVRSARTIREVLQAHQSDATCAACHQNIDPFGYAFENFDPIGAWREEYAVALQPTSAADTNAGSGKDNGAKGKNRKGKRIKEPTSIPIDASSTFLSGSQYSDIKGFRQLMQNDASRDRFVRCFVTKLLTYANGIEPQNFTEVEEIVRASAQHDYRIVETIAAVIDSPLFREE
jgi:mono/diheme cytochrome c family protein